MSCGMTPPLPGFVSRVRIRPGIADLRVADLRIAGPHPPPDVIQLLLPLLLMREPRDVVLVLFPNR